MIGYAWNGYLVNGYFLNRHAWNGYALYVLWMDTYGICLHQNSTIYTNDVPKKKWNNVCGFSNHARISLLYAKPSPCKKHIYWVGTFRKKTSSPDNEQVDLRVFLKVSPQNCLCQLHQLPPKHTSLPLWPTSTKPPQQKHLPSPNGDFCCILREGFPSDVPSKKCTKGTEERKDAKCATRPKSMTCAVSLRPKPPGEWEPNRSG